MRHLSINVRSQKPGISKNVRDLKNCEGSQKLWGISKTVRDLKKCEGSQKMWGISKTVRDLKKCEGSQKMWGISKNVRDLKSLEIAPNPSHSIFGMKKKCWSVWFCETIKHALFLKSHPPNLRRIPEKITFQWQWLQFIGYENIKVTLIVHRESWIPFEFHSGVGSWSECLQVKRSSDVFLRQTAGGECFWKIIS